MSNDLMVQNFTPEQLKLITDTVARGATPDELKLFLYRCKNLGLDPLKSGQIHFIKFNNSPGTIVVGIEGFRAKANATGKLAGIKRGCLYDDQGKCIGGWAEVYRSDWQHPAREEVPLNEYDTGKGPWAKMKQTMIKKVAEAAALRMAFPDDLGGIYAREEMDQAQGNGFRIVADEPGPDDGANSVDRGYRIPFGKFAKRAIEEIDPQQLRDYVNYIERTAERKGQPLTSTVQGFVDRAVEYLVALENGELIEDDKKGQEEDVF